MKRSLVVAISLSLVSVAAAQYNTLEQVQQRGTLTLGVDPNNMPFSSDTNLPPGFEIEIGQKIAAHLGVSFKPFWALSEHPSFPSQLTRKKCDGLIGVIPGSFADTKGIGYTKPYLGTGFVLAVRRGDTAVRDLADLGGKGLGVEAGVVMEKLDYRPRREYPSQEAILAAVQQGEVAAGYVGAVPGGWFLKNHPAVPVDLAPRFIPKDRWNEAIAVRSRDGELKAALDKAIQKMLDAHEIEPILAKYGIPFYAPF